MKKSLKGQKQKNEGQPEPFTFAKNDSNKHTQLSNTNKESNTDEKNLYVNISNELPYENKKMNELASLSDKNTIKENNNKIIEENNVQENEDMMGSYNYEQNDDDFYYFISENIPPQNFSEKLRNIKIKYEKLKNEIEKLKKENNKYKMKKANNWND